MATLDITIALRLFGSLSVSTDLTSPSDAINIAKTQTLTNGTGSNQGNEFWADQRTVTAAAESLNLLDGTLTNVFGDTLTLSLVKGIIIHNKSTTSSENLTLTGDFVTKGVGTGTNELVEPDGLWVRTSPIDGINVTSVSDLLTIDPGAATIIYDIVVWGVT